MVVMDQCILCGPVIVVDEKLVSPHIVVPNRLGDKGRLCLSADGSHQWSPSPILTAVVAAIKMRW